MGYKKFTTEFKRKVVAESNARHEVKSVAKEYGIDSSTLFKWKKQNLDENKEENWDLLGENDTTQSTYCQTLGSNGGCCDDRVGSFSLKQMSIVKGYKHLRWKTKEYVNTEAFITAGIDVYGTLSLSGIKRNGKSICRCRRGPSYLFLIVLFGNFISS